MLYLVLLIYLILIFPLLLNVKFSFDLNKKTGEFRFCLFGLLVFKGKLFLTKQGIVLSFIKNKLIPYSSFLSIRKSMKPLKDYNVLSIKFVAEFGAGDLVKALSIAGFINIALNQTRAIVKSTIPRLKIKNEFKIYEDKEFCCIDLRISAVFNLITVLFSIIKILMEKIIYGIQNRQQNKRSNRGRSKGTERAY